MEQKRLPFGAIALYGVAFVLQAMSAPHVLLGGTMLQVTVQISASMSAPPVRTVLAVIPAKPRHQVEISQIYVPAQLNIMMQSQRRYNVSLA